MENEENHRVRREAEYRARGDEALANAHTASDDLFAQVCALQSRIAALESEVENLKRL